MGHFARQRLLEDRQERPETVQLASYCPFVVAGDKCLKQAR